MCTRGIEAPTSVSSIKAQPQLRASTRECRAITRVNSLRFYIATAPRLCRYVGNLLAEYRRTLVLACPLALQTKASFKNTAHYSEKAVLATWIILPEGGIVFSDRQRPSATNSSAGSSANVRQTLGHIGRTQCHIGATLELDWLRLQCCVSHD